MPGLQHRGRISVRRVAFFTGAMAAALLLWGVANAQAATYHVTTTSDDTGTCSPGGACSLRQAINTINASPAPPDVINVPAGDYVLSNGTLNITENMEIDGVGVGATTIDGNGDEVFFVNGSDPTSVTLSGMTIQGNTGQSDSPTIDFEPSNTATLSLSHDAVINNQIDDVDGAGIFFGEGGNPGGLDITDSTIANNTTTCCVNGAGIAFENNGAGTLTIDRTTLSGNNAGSQDGGAIYFEGDTATITNSTISGNTAAQGGGLNLVAGGTTLTNDTIADNSVSPAGGSGAGIFGASTVSATNTIVSGNTGGAAGMNDCDAHVSSSDHSLENGSDCGFDLNGDPKLGPLADNGGPTQTMALGAGSAAIDAGATVASVTTDQRGGPRPQPRGGAYDVGAYEVGAVADLGISKSASPNPVTVGQTLTYTLTVTNNGASPDPAFGVTVTDSLPNSVTFQSASASQGSCSNSSGTVTCNLGTVNHGASATATIKVTPKSAGTITNTAHVSGSGKDGNTANDSASASAQVRVAAGPKPQAVTGGASAIGFTLATLHGSVNPNGAATTYSFQFGTSTHYGRRTSALSVGSGRSSRSVSRRITGLRPGTLYHYRIVAKNANGTADGQDQTFRTPRRPSLHVSPSRALAGTNVRVFGNAGGCPVGDRVTLISHAFSPAHEFAGVPAVFARVRQGGSYSTTTRVPSGRRPARYVVTARCGGGNLGVSAHVTVFRLPVPKFTG